MKNKTCLISKKPDLPMNQDMLDGLTCELNKVSDFRHIKWHSNDVIMSNFNTCLVQLLRVLLQGSTQIETVILNHQELKTHAIVLKPKLECVYHLLTLTTSMPLDTAALQIAEPTKPLPPKTTIY